jgi:hypothetical protein
MKNLRSGWVVGVVSALAWCGVPLHASDGPPPLAEVRAKAEGGDIQAMVEMAQRFDWGNDGETAQDFAQARVWYEKAAAKGDAYAAYQIAGMFKEGRGVETDPSQAFSWMTRAAEAGLAVAQVELGGMHERAEGTRKNLVKALEWYLKAAGQGEADGMALAGAAYADGRGTKKDVVAGVKWLLRAYDAGREDVETKIWELREADAELGAKLLAASPEAQKLMAEATAGKVDAQVALAKKLRWGDADIFADEQAALDWWRKAAEHGNAEAEAEMGSRYVTATGVEADLALAKDWLEKAAAKNRPEAHFWLGALNDDYAQGDPNMADAARNYRLAAELGHSDAQKRLGQKLEAGEGVEKNLKEALAWYVKAAEQGDVHAMMHVGMLALEKDPAVRDVALAKTWLNKRRGLGYPDGDFLLDQVFEAEEAERLAKEVPASVPERLREAYISGLKGDGEAAVLFAERYRWGRDGLARDAAEAVKWLQRAAEAGSAKGAEMLGEAFLEGAIVGKNADEAVRWLGQAADWGSKTAMVKVADLYAAGEQVPKSELEAARRLEQLAVANDRDAMWRLSRMYSKGLDGGAANLDRAEEWLRKAANLRQPEAEKELARLSAERAAAALAEAKAKAEAPFLEAEKMFALEFDAAISREEREAAVAKFSLAATNAARGLKWSQPQVAERVLQTLLPRMQVNPGEAGAYVMSIDMFAFDQGVLNRMTPANLMTGIRAHAQNVTAAFNAKQAALGPIQSTIEQALAGDVQAMYRAGEYFTQEHAAKDAESAARWFKKAADAGHSEAKERLLDVAGSWYLQAVALRKAGKGAAALKLFRKVADVGEPEAEFEIGSMYFYGEGVARDLAEALKWFRQSAEHGFADAMAFVAWMYRDGEGTTADEVEAARWFQRAADTGDADAKRWLAVLKNTGGTAVKAEAAYLRGTEIAGPSTDDQKVKDAWPWFAYAKRLGHARAAEWIEEFSTEGAAPETPLKEFDEGLAAYQAENFSEALAKWTVAAEKGSATAMFNLGVLHQTGEGLPVDNAQALAWLEKAVTKKKSGAATAVRRVKGNIAFDEGLAAFNANDYGRAMKEWQRAADLGITSAMLNIGVMYGNGNGVAADLQQELAWYRRAGDAGDKNAAEMVAKAQARSVGREELLAGHDAFNDDDYEGAVRLYEKAAGLGNVEAYRTLGELYAEGDGVEKDPRKAIAWYQKAADKGDVGAQMMVDTLESTLPMYDLMASQREMKKLRDQIDGVVSDPAPAAPTGASAGKTTKELRKRRPWTPDEVRAALKDGADQRALAQAIRGDKLERGFTDLELRRLSNTPEGQRVEDFSPLSQVLHENVYPGAGEWTFEMAKAAIEARRAQVGRVAKIVDSPELRTKAAAGDAGALLELYWMPEEQRTQGPITINRDDLARRIEEQKYVRGYSLLADTLRNNVDKTKNDPARRAELLFEGAEAGDPRAMRELAMEFIASSDTALATNYAEAEYWMIEAAARAAEGTMEDPYYNAGRDVAFFYSFSKTTGGPVSWPLSSADEPTLRWAREMIRRGGKLADVANVHLEAFELNSRTKGARAKMVALPPEVPLWSAAEVEKLAAAAKAGDVDAALKLGNGYATGRGVRQRDGKAVVYYEMAAAKGNVAAMRALAEHYFKGFGVQKDGARRLVWLEKAGEAGDASAWTAAGDLLHYGVKEPETVQDFARASVLYQKAVAKGHGPAMHALGVMHELGRGVPKDTAKAVAWYRRAADAGESFSMTTLAGVLKDEKKFTEAAGWYGKAADAGEEHARFWQAQMLARAGDQVGAIPLFREVVAKTPTNSTAWLELGAALHDTHQAAGAKEAYRKVIELVGESDGQGKLAKELLGELEANETKAPAAASSPAAGKADRLLDEATQAAMQDKGREVVKLIQAAAAVGETASPWNRHRLAMILAQGLHGVPKDEARARELLKSAADAGYANAKLDYAMALMQGALGFTADQERGRALLAELVADADQVNADAKYQIGMMIFHGNGVPADRVRGINLVKAAAEWSVPAAQFEIGRALLMGMPELPADPAKGVEFLQKAMQSGLPAAAAVLGEVYEKGITGPAGGKPIVMPNPQEALRLYEAALKAGVQQVKPAVERLQLQLSGKGPRPEKNQD